jgi:hypothetical protein
MSALKSIYTSLHDLPAIMRSYNMRSIMCHTRYMLMKKCWSRYPTARPTFEQIVVELKRKQHA